MAKLETKTLRDLKTIILIIASISVVTSVLLLGQYANASDPNDADCSRCHPISMERHRFPTSPCTTCHSPDMSSLTLKNGEAIPIEQSPSLCAQCHGDIYQAWQQGKHGIATIKCVGCHDPHLINKPQTIPLAPFPFTSILEILVAGATLIGVSLLALVAAIRLREK